MQTMGLVATVLGNDTLGSNLSETKKNNRSPDEHREAVRLTS